MSVEVVGEVSVDRSRVRLDGRTGGCPKVDLSVSGKVTVQVTGKAEGKTVGGALSVFTATNSTFSVSVSPEAAEAIERGDRQPPNPLDPRTLVPGESIALSEEFFAGHNLQVSYRNLQIGMGFEEGRRLSSGVRRVDERTVRVFVGDSEFVRQALSVGTSVGDFGVALGGTKELSQGEVRTVDIDISTPEGFAAYQKFIADGQMPQPGTPGTSNPLSISAVDFSGSTVAEVSAGNFRLGGVLNDAEGSIVEVRHADGTVDHVSQARANDVGAAITENKDGKTFSLFMENVDPSLIEAFEQLLGQGPGRVRRRQRSPRLHRGRSGGHPPAGIRSAGQARQGQPHRHQPRGARAPAARGSAATRERRPERLVRPRLRDRPGRVAGGHPARALPLRRRWQRRQHRAEQPAGIPERHRASPQRRPRPAQGSSGQRLPRTIGHADRVRDLVRRLARTLTGRAYRLRASGGSSRQPGRSS